MFQCTNSSNVNHFGDKCFTINYKCDSNNLLKEVKIYDYNPKLMEHENVYVEINDTLSLIKNEGEIFLSMW